jgi:predicted amidohydrolase
MAQVRVALANLPYPASREDSIVKAIAAINDASAAGALVVCFPECYVPGYRTPDRHVPPPDQQFLDSAWRRIATAAGAAKIAVVLGTERVTDKGVVLTALVINADGSIAGFQDKRQIDPSEEPIYVTGDGNHVFKAGPLTFGIAICHEGWRYPETVRAAARSGAQLVFHPHFHEADANSFRPSAFADPRNTFHEKAALCRAAENTIFFAMVNCASDGSPTTSAFVRPDGTLLSSQPYGKAGLLIADLQLDEATRLLATRLRQ